MGEMERVLYVIFYLKHLEIFIVLVKRQLYQVKQSSLNLLIQQYMISRTNLLSYFKKLRKQRNMNMLMLL